MLKNNDVIAKLTDGQKVRLLTGVGSLSGKDFKILGLRGVKACNTKDYCRDTIPHAAILSNAWNEELWYEVAGVKANELAKDEADLALVPGAKIKISPFRREMTEDPFLASRFSAVHSAACKDAGLRTALSGYYLTGADVEWMDTEPSDRVLNEFIGAPYATAADLGRADAVLTDVRHVSEKYQKQLRDMQDTLSKEKYLVCESASDENTVDFISRGIICLSASANVLEAAIARHKKLLASMERGDGVTPQQLEDEEKRRTAISMENVDKAVDHVIEFIKSRGEYTVRDIDNVDDVAYRAALESAVLLKNKDGVLPLDKSSKIALVGGILPEDENGENGIHSLMRELKKRGCNCVGTELGYDTSNLQRTYGFERALKLTHSASVVVMLLGFGYENEKKASSGGVMDLPANQLRLADLLVKRGKTVVGVVASGYAPDIAFTRGFKGLMIAPLEVKHSISALAALLSGEVSPSGKLAYTLYAGSETAFKKRALYKNKYGLKCGPFVGYRYYDTAGLKLGYPFGHGLSYSKFEYSDISYSNGAVSFTVENVGDMCADEVAQIYMGIADSAVLRPKKELCGFVKLKLAPAEKKRVKIAIKAPTVYHSGEFKTEQGVYDVFVGSSVFDIRLSTRVALAGNRLTSDRERLIDYIQSVTNVTEDNFTLEANYSPMSKKSLKNILAGVGTLAVALSIAVFNVATGISSVFLGCVAGILAIFAVCFFAAEVIERSSSYADDKARISEKNKEHFNDAEQLSVFSTDKMFAEEFDTETQVVSAENEHEAVADERELSEYINADFKLADLVNELSQFCEEKGMRLDAGVARNIAVSLASSKLLVFDGISSQDFNSLMIILSEYFATRTYVDKLDGSVKDVNDLFYSYDQNGDYIKRSSVMVLDDAALAEDKVHILGVDGVNKASFEKLVKPFANYLASSKERSTVQIFNEYGTNVGFNVTKNLKIAVRLAEDTSVDMLPASVLRMASYNHVTFVRCQAKSAWSTHHGCNRYQLEYIFEKESSAAGVSEKLYKKVDKLESFVSSHTDYLIGNKLWLAFEKQIGLQLSANAELDEATDAAVATKLLPSMSAALYNKLTQEDETLKGTVEFTFGEENVALCAKLLNANQEKQASLADAEMKAKSAVKDKAKNNTDTISLDETVTAVDDEIPVEVVEDVLVTEDREGE